MGYKQGTSLTSSEDDRKVQVGNVPSGLTESKERHADGLALIAFDLVRQTQNVARMPVIRQNDVTLNLKIGTDRVLRPVWSIRCG